MRRVDIHSHFISPDFVDHLRSRDHPPMIEHRDGRQLIRSAPGLVVPVIGKLTDLQEKLADMDDLGIDFAVLSHAVPGPESLGGAEADDWAKRANDHLADLIRMAPERISAWGMIGFGDADTVRTEMDRCVKDLGFPGFQLYSNVRGDPLDSSHILDVIGHAAELGVPMNLHPSVPLNQTGMENLTILTGLGFVADTTLNVLRLILSGIFDRYPDLKLIVPHVGGVLPYIRGRLAAHSGRSHIQAHEVELEHSLDHYLLKLYMDSVTGDVAALRCAFELLGPERILYGTDHPFANYRQAAGIVGELGLPEKEEELIYHDNARRLLGLA